MKSSYDYIIVGAGSTGCVLAERLSANGKHSVLLIEAGARDTSPWITMPKGIAKLVTEPANIWAYAVSQPRKPGTDPQEVWIRGKGLGGSSSINGMIWSRGERQDYDDWERAGASGWNGATMTAAYRAVEDHSLSGSDARGEGGPVHITHRTYKYPLAERMIRAGEEMGLTKTDDLNSVEGGRVGYYSHNIRKGRRQSGATVFLRPAEKRSNCTILPETLVVSVRMSNRRAVGLSLVNDEQGAFSVDCKSEIILCAGTMESPQILQRSGIGDGKALKSLGIDVEHDNPNVGRHMLEHISYTIPFELKRNTGIQDKYQGLGLLGSLARYYTLRDGPMATGPFEVGAFASTDGPSARTNLQLYLSGYMFALSDDNHPVPLANVDKRPALTVSGTLLRQESEGEIRVRGAAPADGADIEPNWLSTETDRQAAIASIRMMREYVGQNALADDVSHELLPGNDVESDEELLESFRLLSTSGLHGVGTCRMGRENEAVVDPQLKVYGVEGMRVADCSVMPGLVTGNTNAPAMALGWRAAELILEDTKLPG